MREKKREGEKDLQGLRHTVSQEHDTEKKHRHKGGYGERIDKAPNSRIGGV